MGSYDVKNKKAFPSPRLRHWENLGGAGCLQCIRKLKSKYLFQIYENMPGLISTSPPTYKPFDVPTEKQMVVMK